MSYPEPRLVFTLALVMATAVLFGRLDAVQAQGYGALGISVVGPSANCPAPLTGTYYLCPTTDKGLLGSNNGGAYGPVGGAGAAVTSVFGRTGAVVAAPGDYSYTQLSGTAPIKPSFTCTQFSLINSASPPMAVNGCN